ncbi:hypothetical protein ACLOJK_027233 [Asimina triloba]
MLGSWKVFGRPWNDKMKTKRAHHLAARACQHGLGRVNRESHTGKAVLTSKKYNAHRKTHDLCRVDRDSHG